MTTTELTFQEKGTTYVCEINEYNKGDVIQIQLREKGIVSVSANATDMIPSVVGQFESKYDKSVIFSLDIPDGLQVTLETSKQVIKAVLVQK